MNTLSRGQLGPGVLAVVLCAVLMALGLLEPPAERRMETFQRRHAAPGGDLSGAPPETVESSTDMPRGAIEPLEPGRIVLDVSEALFSVRPGPAGEPISSGVVVIH